MVPDVRPPGFEKEFIAVDVQEGRHGCGVDVCG